MIASERHATTRTEVYTPSQERLRGQKNAVAILREFPATDDLSQEAALATQEKHHKIASEFQLLSETPQFIQVSTELQAIKERLDYDNYADQNLLKKDIVLYGQTREKVFAFDESVKEFLNRHPDESIDYVSGFALTSYQVLPKDQQPLPIKDAHDKIHAIARGMRAELATEKILGLFTEDVDFNYDLEDNKAVRRNLDAKGVDYVLDVTALGQVFQIGVDIKANFNKTIDSDGYAIPGKLWCQCGDEDFVHNSTKISPRALYPKLDSMRRALLVQIQCQYPGQLEDLCAQEGIEIDDIELN